MDVIKNKYKNNMFKRKYQIGIAVCLLVSSLFVWAMQTANTISLSRKDILVERVEYGNLDVTIEGYGVLSSSNQQLLTALTQATVKEIVLKPGSDVTVGSVIVRLDNPELIQALNNAEQELLQIKANSRQLKLNNQRELLNESANLEEVKAQYDAAVLAREAEGKLVESGVVAQLTYQRSLLNERQLANRINIFEQRIEQLKLVHEESLNIVQEQVKQQQDQVSIAQSRLAALEIKAGFVGVLQELHVELGQSLLPGQEIALVGSATDLIAYIRVPQSQAQQVAIGQVATINTRRDKILGKVTRINPVVQDNTVEVEVSFSDNLPASARLQLNVDAVITADTLKQIHYIKRPANTREHSEIEMYRLDSKNSTAQLQTLKLGQNAGHHIEVVSGATANDLFIISDLSNLKDTVSEITITR